MIPASQIPVPALPTPQVVEISTGVSRLLPLSRKGTGPGVIVVIPETNKSLAIEDGVPSPFIKWGEEGYTVVLVKASALATSNPKSVLEKSLQALSECDQCLPKDTVGLVGKSPGVTQE